MLVILSCGTTKSSGAVALLVQILSLILGLAAPALAESHPSLPAQNPPSLSSQGLIEWLKNVETDWGGYLKVRGGVSWPDDDSFYAPVGTGTFYDWNSEGRLTNKLMFGEKGYLETHYEVVALGGDTWKKQQQLKELFPGFSRNRILEVRPVDDDRRFMDLTWTISEGDEYVVYQRLDRLNITALPSWGVVRVGRQAVTWGNGLIFNPMDLINPFPPADIERDYKLGDDMIAVEVVAPPSGNLQLLYAPRRNPENGDVEWDQSSLGGKLHLACGTTELDIMAAHNYDDKVMGIGTRGYVGEAAWRLDSTYTFVDRDTDVDDYLSLMANVDMSWVWWGRNWYGFLEGFYNGLGSDDYAEAFSDSEIQQRFDRGYLFALGRYYLSGHVTVELHPLFRVSVTTINNVEDPSGIIIPWATWSVVQDVEVEFGCRIFWGGSETEYRGFSIPGTGLLVKPADNLFLWLKYYF